MPNTPAESSTPAKAGARRSPLPGSTVPYYVAAFFAAAAMAWYFFVFVPSKIDYFVGVRLRALAVASSQVKAKADNLASALATAPWQDTERYLRALVPEIQLGSAGGGRRPGLHLVARHPPPPDPDQPVDASKATSKQLTPAAGTQPATVQNPLTGTVSWDDVMAQAVEVSRADFDDLVLALPSGEVVWQRETTTPRVGNLAEVLYAEPPESSWFSLDWTPNPELPKTEAKDLPKAVAAKTVHLGGRSSLLLAQAVTLTGDGIEPTAQPSSTAAAREKEAAAPPSSRPTLVVAGLVSTSTLKQQAMHVPLAWIVLLSLPVILLFLALPFVKLATLTARERFGFADAVVLLLTAIMTAGVASTIPFVATPVDEDTDDALKALADKVETGMADDVRRVLAFGRDLVHHRDEVELRLEACQVEVTKFEKNRCNLWAAMAERTGHLQPGDIDLDVVIWLDGRGEQADKWTTKAQVTGRTSQSRFQHFRDLAVQRLWRLSGPMADDLPPFTIEPLRAPTTADLGVIVAFPLNDTAGRERFLALNLRLPSVLDLVVPPGFGFAVMANDGRVVFHSDENRSLHENFFEEVGEPAAVRDRAHSGRVVTWSGDYHGRPHRIHVQPLASSASSRTVSFVGCPWRIVTFRDLAPTLAAVTAHQSGTSRLAAINLAALVILAAAAAIVCAMKHRNVRDLLNVPDVTRPNALWVLVGLTVAASVVLLITHSWWVRPHLDAVYGLFVVLPFCALIVAANARRPTASENRQRTPLQDKLVAAELALLVLLVAALPAAGFARIVDRVQAIDRTSQWLEEMQRRIAQRNERVLARVNGPAYGDTSASGKTRKQLKAGFANTALVRKYTYLDFLPAKVRDEPPADISPGRPDQGQSLVRFLLGWNPFPSRDLAGHPPVTAEAKSFRLEPLAADARALVVPDPGSTRPDSTEAATEYSLPQAKLVFGLLLLGGTIAALYWARRRLLVHPPVDAPTIRAVLDCLPRNGSHGLMVIGPPRTRKDREVDEALRERGERTDIRLRLLGNVADAAFVEAALKPLNPVPPRGWWRWRQPRNVEPGSALWIHVSDLETHLVGPERRKLALEMLERLLDRAPGGPSRIVVVTTTVDPIAHFEEIFEEERAGIYDDAVPEVELSRFSVLLTRFHRAYLPIAGKQSEDPWWDYDPAQWKSVLKWETGAAPLQHIGEELKEEWKGRDSVSLEQLVRAISTRAFAVYQLLWASCTRREKLVLVQLAQEGFVTPQSADVVAALMAKGLIVQRPGPAIFNYSFRGFLRTIERGHVVREWERVEGHGLWFVAGRLVASTVAAGGLFFLLTQGYSVEALLPVLSGTGVFGVPLMRTLMARVSGSSSTGSATA